MCVCVCVSKIQVLSREKTIFQYFGGEKEFLKEYYKKSAFKHLQRHDFLDVLNGDVGELDSLHQHQIVNHSVSGRKKNMSGMNFDI